MKIKFIFVVLLFLVLGCRSSDYTEDLGDGYLFAATNKHNHSIVKGLEAVVDSNIVFYKVDNGYVIGYREEPQWYEVDESLISKNYGYFILNKKTGDLAEGLTEKDYRVKTKELGIELKLK